MKNSKYYLALTLAIALNVSCSKFEDGPGFSFIPAESRLTGEWAVVEVEGTGYDALFNSYLNTGQFFINFEFEDGGDGLFSYGYNYDGYFYSYGYSLDWTLDDNRLDIFMDGDQLNFEVQRLSRKELNIKALNDDFFDVGTVLMLEKE
jgi:hypothetical protein